jgi:LysR family cyn operon transcriptional activator
MELRQLRYLIAIAEAGNFTRAAETVFVSQSALSQQIQTMEQEIGTLLLDRSKTGVRLTAAGEILCHHARQMLRELNEAKVAIEELEGLKRGELRIGVVQTVNAYLMPAIATTFNGHYPDVKLSIEELAADDIESGLEQGDLQVGVGFIPPTSTSLESAGLFEERLVLVVRRDHPLAQQESVAVKELDEMALIMLTKTFCTRRLWEENARFAAAQPRVVLEMNTVNSILSVVEKTGLPTILPQFTLLENSTDLVALPLRNPVPSRQVGLLWHRDYYLCASSRAFIDMATGLAAEIARGETDSGVKMTVP